MHPIFRKSSDSAFPLRAQHPEDAADAAEQQRDPEPDKLHFLQRTAGKQTEAKQQKNE